LANNQFNITVASKDWLNQILVSAFTTLWYIQFY